MRENRRRFRPWLAIAALAAAWPRLASADEDPYAGNALGDIAGLRTTLATEGISFGLVDVNEIWGNASGGIHRGIRYDALTTANLAIDAQQAFGWNGGDFYASGAWIRGRNISADDLAALQLVSGIEAQRSLRLWELWYRQKFLDDRVELRVGQQAIDLQFAVSEYSSLFLNSAMGWPALPANDLYAGGPTYPLSSPGISLEVHASDGLTFRAGVFDDNPPGGPFNNNSQTRGAEASGLAFNLGTGALALAEVQYTVNPPTENRDATAPAGLTGTYKLGAWVDTGPFPDQRFDALGLSLANPASNGVARMHQGNFGVYGLIDQMLWRADPAGPQYGSVFLRALAAPPDRNLVDFSLDAGIHIHAPLPGRDSDAVGIGYGIAHISSRAAALDRDTAAFTGASYPARSAEHFLEVTYEFEAKPWWRVQPDFQYLFNPGGGIPNPNAPTQRIRDEAVFGLRSTITF